MSQACSISTGKTYGLQRVCRVWKLARSTVYQHRQKRRFPMSVHRRGPQGPCSDEQLVDHIKDLAPTSSWSIIFERYLLKAHFMAKDTVKCGQN
jgi:hypothetical protein